MRQSWYRRLIGAALVLCISIPARAAGSFHINLIAGSGLSGNVDAMASFQLAIADWESRISSPIQINIAADLLAPDQFSNSNTIGATSSAADNFDYDTVVRPAMAARATRAGDSILAFLPVTSAQLTAHVPNGTTFQNTTVGLTRANQKALGIVPNAQTDTVLDASMVFNSGFTFGYNRASLNASNVDFQTAVTHEIGHVLGFLSDVDEFDTSIATADNLTTLDLFRFNASEKPASVVEFSTNARELRPGQASVTSDVTSVYNMSTGVFQGDGDQASHWQDDTDPFGNLVRPTIGIMDPTLANGVFEEISAADMRAVELIGYDTVPEPTSLAFVGMATIALLSRRRRIHRAGSHPG